MIPDVVIGVTNHLITDLSAGTIDSNFRAERMVVP